MAEQVTTDPPPRAGKREWLGLAVLALPCMLYSMDLTVLNLAIPHLSAALLPTSAQLLWIVDIYGFLLASALITMGTLGDRIGRRRLLLIGAAAFGVTSVLTAFSRNAEMLIAARALLGVAAAALAPSTLSLIRNMFADSRQRTVAISVWVTSFSAGAAIGPVVGGVLLQHFWWGSVFLVAVPVMLLLLMVGPMLLPESRDSTPRRLDVTSAALSLVTVLAVIYGLKEIAQNEFGWATAMALLCGLASGVAFVRRQQRLSDPLIDFRLFGNRTFGAALTGNTLDFFVGFGINLFIAQHLQLVIGLSPQTAGLWLVPSAGGSIVGSLLTPWLVRRTPPAYVMAVGLGVTAAGFGLLTEIDGAWSLPMLVIGSLVVSLGIAPMTTLSTDIMVRTVPPEQAGAASGISETSSEFGGALGIAVLGSIGTASYRASVANTLPAGMPHEAMEAARNTLGGAVAAAGYLSERTSIDLLHLAREAFTSSFELVAGICIAISLGTALLAATCLRHVGVDAAREELH